MEASTILDGLKGTCKLGRPKGVEVHKAGTQDALARLLAQSMLDDSVAAWPCSSLR
jgi:anti-anti-sigma regulatory factor